MYSNSFLCLKNITIFSEIFLSISILLILLYSTFIGTKKKKLIIQNSIFNLAILTVILLFSILINNSICINNSTNFNNSLSNDFLIDFSKIVIVSFSFFCFIIIKQYLKHQKINQFEYILLILFSLLGTLFLCSSNDFLTAYLSIELQSLSFYVLAAFKKNSNFSIDAGLKYFILGSLSSGIFLLSCSFLYGYSGSQNFEDLKDLFFWVFLFNIDFIKKLDFFILSQDLNDIFSVYFLKNHCIFFSASTEKLVFSSLNNVLNSPLTEEEFLFFCEQKIASTVSYNFDFFCNISNIYIIKFSLILLLISIFFKIALAPFHIWSPDIYENSATSSSFIFSIIPKLGLFLFLIKILYYSFYGFFEIFQFFLIKISIFSIIIGSFTALEQRKLKTLIAYSSISHMGYSLLAFSSGLFEGVQMLFFYLIIYLLSGVFIWSVFILFKLKHKFINKANKELSEFSSLFRSNKIIAFLFSFVLLSLAGFPPLVGFLAKTNIFLVSMESFLFYISIISILCSVVATFYYLRIIKIIFFENKLTGNLFQCLNIQDSLLLIFIFYFFIIFFINPSFLYLICYKSSFILTLF